MSVRQGSRTRRVAPFIAVLAFLSAFGGCQKARQDENALPEIGTQMPSLLEGARLLNAPVGVGLPEKGWVIYAFSPKSSSCAENSSSIEALADSLPRDWALISVSTEDDGLLPFLARNHLTIPVLPQASREALAQYRVVSTPRTYILDKDWKLLEVLDGAFRGEVAARLSARFGVPIQPASVEGSSARAQDRADTQDQEIGRPARLCLDSEQRPYSRGAKAEVFGELFECGVGGVWIPLPYQLKRDDAMLLSRDA